MPSKRAGRTVPAPPALNQQLKQLHERVRPRGGGVWFTAPPERASVAEPPGFIKAAKFTRQRSVVCGQS